MGSQAFLLRAPHGSAFLIGAIPISRENRDARVLGTDRHRHRRATSRAGTQKRGRKEVRRNLSRISDSSASRYPSSSLKQRRVARFPRILSPHWRFRTSRTSFAPLSFAFRLLSISRVQSIGRFSHAVTKTSIIRLHIYAWTDTRQSPREMIALNVPSRVVRLRRIRER